MLVALVLVPFTNVSAETIAGEGNIGYQDGVLASFHMPIDVLVLPGGEVIVADTFNNLLRIIRGSETTTYAGFIPEFFPVGFHRDGELSAAGLHHPTGLAICENGRIYVADSVNNSIRVIVAGSIYTLAGWGEAGFSDGPRGEAAFNSPTSIAIGPGGNLYVADTLNHVIRRVSPTGHTTTIAGTPGEFGYQNGASALFDTPMGIAVTGDGRIFVADTGNHAIRVIENGIVTTLAGSSVHDEWDSVGGFADGIGTAALFNQPRGLSLWGDNLIVADSANHAIRVVTPDGSVTTFAGLELELLFPMGVHVHEERLYIADSGNNKIRAVSLR